MNKIIVVEGKNDYSKIKQIYPDAQVLITNGSAVSEVFLKELKILSETNEIVLFLDPDFPGEKIRKTIMNVIPNCSHAFVEKNKAISKNKKKVGVEHVDEDVIKESLKNIKTIENKDTIELTVSELYDMGLVGQKDSKDLRDKVCSKLGIGYVNSKQFINRMKMFGIDKKKILEVLDNDR